MNEVQTNNVVDIEYTLTDSNGELLDSSKERDLYPTSKEKLISSQDLSLRWKEKNW